MESNTSLVIQFIGVLLITTLSLFLRRSLKTVSSTYWAIGWSGLSFALFWLCFGYIYQGLTKPVFCLYFLGEYIFGLMLIFGCRTLSEDYEFKPLNKLIFLPFAILALGLPFLLGDLGLVFNIHVLLMGTLFGAVFVTLKSVKLRGFGWRTMRVAIALLALDFYQYFIVYVLLKFKVELPLPPNFLAFNSIVDLVLEVLLGFGMIIILLEQVLSEMKIVNEKLQAAHEKLEQTAHIDPLTTAFNRHAFYGYLRKQGEKQTEISGCVGFFDIDDLKPINDLLGHAVGDLAIRAVAGAIRDLMRAEDLIYRWGGDEFFVLMVSMTSEMARDRMFSLERKLTDIRIEGAEKPLTIRVSYGFKDFAAMNEMEQAINAADEEMYRGKQARKLRRRLSKATTFLSNDNIMISAER